MMYILLRDLMFIEKSNHTDHRVYFKPLGQNTIWYVHGQDYISTLLEVILVMIDVIDLVMVGPNLQDLSLQ